MFDLLTAGGFLIWPILLCSVIAVAIIIERAWSLTRKNVSPSALPSHVRELLQRDAIDDDAIAAVERHSPLGEIFAAGLKHPNRHRVAVKEAVEEAGRHVVHGLARRLQTLGTIAAITPLLGLLGTVIGMIKVFSAITTFGVGDPQALAVGISEALVTTAAGLTVGIPSLMFHRYFLDKVNELAVYLEQQAVQFIDDLDGGGRHR